MKPKMYFITKTFPYDDVEASFIDPEVPFLREKFDVTFIAADADTSLNQQVTIGDKIFSTLQFLTKKTFYQECRQIFHEKKHIYGNIKRALMYGTYAEVFWKRLRTVCDLKKDTKAVFYFFWWDYRCLGVTMHRKRCPGIKIVTRTHGYDLYDHREVYGRQYFKPQMDKKLDKIFFIAEYGKEYYLNRYGKMDGPKYVTSCLGVKRQERIDFKLEKEFVLMSCSVCIPLKRVELIIEGLALVEEQPVKWIHVGAGEKAEDLKRLAQERLGGKKNITFMFLGRLDNADVMKLYSSGQVSCFITTTSTEGSPVSVQEALSFGCPVIGTAVSDIPKMIEENGVLLQENPDAEEVASAILKISQADVQEREEMGKKSYEIWERMYDSEKNRRSFADVLAALSEV